MTPRPEMEGALEAILFASSEPVPRGRLLELFDEGERAEAQAALEAVLARYRPQEGRGVTAEEVAGGVRLITRPELGGWLKRFFEVRGAAKLSMAALETLAIVAYRQPITAPEIQELRSVNPAGVLKTLLERRLVKIAGRKPVVGNPFLYRTTKEFLVHFGLGSLQDLPPLEEFEETFGDAEPGEPSAGAGTAGRDAPAGGEGGGADREEVILRQAADLDEAEAAREPFAAEETGQTAARPGSTQVEAVEAEPAEVEAR
jgi:segregation and condensation protein B